jgi:2-polyprenyl-6-methoxyphenol hydroxylase-like FAD-dependent oxidoreductase
MADVLICGGGICGLGLATMLARDGHEVTVLEADADGPPASPEKAWQSWERPGVYQFRLSHFMHSRFRHVLEANLPDVGDRLIEAGATRFDPLTVIMPPTIEDRSPRPDDDKYWTLTARRPILESSFAQTAEDEPGVKIVRGVEVAGFLTGAEAIKGVPNIVGVETAGGEKFRADIVIDAMGRRSPTPQFLQDVGGRSPIEEAEDCGFIYYGRHFRARDGNIPQAVGPLLSEFHTFSVLTLPCDNETWTTVVWTSSGDQQLKQLRFEDKWTKLMRSLPLQAHWLDGDPVDELKTMGGIMDRYRRFVVDGGPVATGLLPVADAWGATNPSLGRGISIGLWQASRLRDHLRSLNGDPKEIALGWDAITEGEFKPWYQAQVDMDRARVAEIEANRLGAPQPDPGPMGQITKSFFTAMMYDPDIFRAFLEVMGCLSTPAELLAQPGMFDKLIAASEGREPFALPGPTREELLHLVA